MKKAFLLFSILLSLFSSHAQTSAISYNSNTFTVTSFNNNRPLIQRAVNNVPGSILDTSSAFVLEYGDGRFTSDSNSTHYYSDNNDRIAVLSLSGRYDTIKPPPVFAKKITNIIPTRNIQPAQNLLQPGENIRITPIANNINPRDEMLYIITYKVPAMASNVKVVFFYNQQGISLFLDPASSQPLVNFNTSSSDNGYTNIPRIRKYHYETDLQPNLTGLANLVNNISSVNNGLTVTNYNNNLSWEIESPIPGEERNIFLTLRTNDNLTNNATAIVEAALIYKIVDAAGGGLKQEYNGRSVSTISTNVSLNPHDPNYILAAPHCIKIDPRINTTRVKFHIRTQNEGGGNAHRLEIKVIMPDLLKESILHLTTDSFIAKVANRAVDVDGITKENNTFTLIFNDLSHSKNPNSNDSSLSGNFVPNWICNPLTWADIYFTLDVPSGKKADIVSKAEITFFTSSGGKVHPVTTSPDTLFIREECNGMLYPAIRPIPSSCNCKKLGPLCWYWWLLIGGGTVIIIWAIFRRRKREEEKTGYRA